MDYCRLYIGTLKWYTLQAVDNGAILYKSVPVGKQLHRYPYVEYKVLGIAELVLDNKNQCFIYIQIQNLYKWPQFILQIEAIHNFSSLLDFTPYSNDLLFSGSTCGKISPEESIGLIAESINLALEKTKHVTAGALSLSLSLSLSLLELQVQLLALHILGNFFHQPGTSMA